MININIVDVWIRIFLESVIFIGLLLFYVFFVQDLILWNEKRPRDRSAILFFWFDLAIFHQMDCICLPTNNIILDVLRKVLNELIIGCTFSILKREMLGRVIEMSCAFFGLLLCKCTENSFLNGGNWDQEVGFVWFEVWTLGFVCDWGNWTAIEFCLLKSEAKGELMPGFRTPHKFQVLLQTLLRMVSRKD